MTHGNEHSAAALHRAAAEGGTRGAELLRRAGCRPTPQRLEVLQALGGGERLTADQLYDRVRGAIPTINPSTVYRTLEVLEDVGLVRCADLGAGRMHSNWPGATATTTSCAASAAPWSTCTTTPSPRRGPR